MNQCQVLILASLLTLSGIAQAQIVSGVTCPVTVGSNSLGPPFPESETWYGSELLAVMLPDDGKWDITAPGARIAVKLAIWSLGYEPGMEENLTIRVESLSGDVSDVVVKDITNAGSDSLGWTMLAGIDFPRAGCWQLTLDYSGQSLSFVIVTVEPAIEGTAALGSALMATACTPARFGSLEPAAEANQSEVLVYRASAFNAGGYVAIFGADRKDLLELGNDTYAELRLVPKTYEFFVRINEADRPHRLTIELKQNDRRCLEAYPNPNRLLRLPLFFIGTWFGSTFLLREVDCPSSQGIASYEQVAPTYE